MDGVDNTKINMKLHTFYGLVQCAEIKCEHIILSVASVCTNGLSIYCLPTHQHKQPNPNPNRKFKSNTKSVLYFGRTITTCLSVITLFVCSFQHQTYREKKNYSIHISSDQMESNKGVKQTEDQHREY